MTAAIVKTPGKTTEMPVGFRLTYAPHLVDRVFRKWAQDKYPSFGEMDIESQAHSNLDMESDLGQWYFAVDYAAYLKQSKVER